MTNDDRDKRLAGLNRRPLNNLTTRSLETSPFDSENNLLQGVEYKNRDGKSCYLIQRDDLERDGIEPINAVYRGLTELFNHPLIELNNTAFLDIETTGLGGQPLFLIGLVVFDENYPISKQFFARNLNEEIGVISAVINELKDKTHIITYNGKTFDLPYIVNRCSYHGVRFRAPEHHLDLIYPARKKLKGILPNCKLQTLERGLFNRVREDDLPGHMVPAAYYHYLRTGSVEVINKIIKHNVDDLTALLNISALLLHKT